MRLTDTKDHVPAPDTTQPSSPVRPAPWRSPAQFLACGFGAGLSPKAPGTVGTAVAVPLYWLAADWGLPLYSVFVVGAALLGVWVCGAASRQLRVHDHPAIVWDEFVGYWITLWAMPVDWLWMAAGFVVFRVYDIVKPWPVNLLDKREQGGLGIMIDDILAGLMACATLHLAVYLA